MRTAEGRPRAGLWRGAAALVVGLLLTAGAALSAAPAPAQAPAARPHAAIGPADMTFVDDGPGEGEGGKPPANPFAGSPAIERKDAVPGYIEVSTGLKIPGKIYTTRGKRLKVYNLDRERYEYLPVPAIVRIDTTVEWERVDKEWRFKEAGNPEKVYSGRTYPLRKTAYTLTLRNGYKIRGHILGQPLYVEHNGKAERFILHDRDKGAMGETLESLVYVTRVELGPEAYNQAVDELKARAEAAAGQGGAAAPPPAKKD
jgi:hypothetical protein